jgi:hypothetical protein
MLRPIAADNSCLFNAVGYTMHHSTNRAPFLRQVVSREVSSDPQVTEHVTISQLTCAFVCRCVHDSVCSKLYQKASAWTVAHIDP